ncbi:MAG: Alkanesulfonate monooxygenase [Frankiales bacterium]|nr:Alkanesulfonate monooxygenase [Frankiales bacterium]
MQLHWFLPTGGDSRHVGSATVLEGRTAAAVKRAPTVEYLGQVARAAEAAGFESVLTPVGAGCEDPLVLCAAVAQHTTTLKFLVAFRPGFVLPSLLAQQAATFQRLTGDRLLLNVVTGGDPVEQRAYGDFLGHDERYERTGEFLEVLDRMWSGDPFDHRGKHFQLEGAGLKLPPTTAPRIYFGGASPAAEKVAVARADTYLTWGEPPAMVRERVERVQKAAADAGKELRLGIRLHVIARRTPEEAWVEADRILAGMSPEAIRASQDRYARMDSVGQARMASLHGGSADGLEIAPNLWAGVGLVREGAATALVGSYEQVAERLVEYRDLGFDEAILSGWPHLEEAYNVGENVAPLL